MLVSDYRRLFHSYNLTQLGPVKEDLKVYNFTGVNVIGSCVLYLHTCKSKQAQTFNITGIEDSLLLICADTLALPLGVASHKLNKKIHSGARVVISKADRYGAYAVNRKVQGNPLIKSVGSYNQIQATKQLHTQRRILLVCL